MAASSREILIPNCFFFLIFSFRCLFAGFLETPPGCPSFDELFFELSFVSVIVNILPPMNIYFSISSVFRYFKNKPQIYNIS